MVPKRKEMDMYKLLALTLAMTGLLLMGCESEEVSTGQATMSDESTTRRGDIAPTVAVVSQNGKRTTMDEMTQPIYIVAFVDSKGNCGMVDSRLEKLARELNLEDVSVVQITEGCSNCGELMEKAAPQANNLHVLCDGVKQATWKAFGQPKMGTLFLINTDDRIETSAMLDGDLTKLKFEARELNEEYEERLQRQIQE
jgi:hypothetical protein